MADRTVSSSSFSMTLFITFYSSPDPMCTAEPSQSRDLINREVRARQLGKEVESGKKEKRKRTMDGMRRDEVPRIKKLTPLPPKKVEPALCVCSVNRRD